MGKHLTGVVVVGPVVDGQHARLRYTVVFPGQR